MATIAVSGNDTLIINNRVLVDFADANCAELTFPNELANAKTGKNGNAIYSSNANGRTADLRVRLIRGSPDDKFMNGLAAAQMNNFEGWTLLIGQFIKKIGNGAGRTVSDTYILGGGMFTKIPEAKTNTDGDSDQSVSTYVMRFTTAPRALT